MIAQPDRGVPACGARPVGPGIFGGSALSTGEHLISTAVIVVAAGDRSASASPRAPGAMG